MDKGVVACLYESVLARLDNKNKDYFDVDVIHSLYGCFEYFSTRTLLGIAY